MLRRSPLLLIALFLSGLISTISLPAIARSNENIVRSEEVNSSVSNLGLKSLLQTNVLSTPPLSEIIAKNSSRDLVQQGKEFYAGGKFSDAAKVWSEAASSFAQEKDILNQAMALTLLSLANQQLAQWEQAKDAIAQSLTLLSSQTNTQKSELILAQALNAKGNLELRLGNGEEALSLWQQATVSYTKAGDNAGVIGSLINQAQAMQVQGLYRRASKTLEEVEQKLQQQPDSLIKAIGLRSLGNTLRQVGNLEGSQKVLQQGLEISQKLGLSAEIAETLLGLGNTNRNLQQPDTALKFYQEAAASSSVIVRTQAQLNQLSVLLDEQRWNDAQVLASQLQPQVTNLPASRSSIYARINLAQSWKKLLINYSKLSASNQKSSSSATINTSSSPAIAAIDSRKTMEDIAILLAGAIKQAENIQDPRAKSYALGTLGTLYKDNEQWSNAQEMTEQALLIAQAINASDIAYQWQWQLGKLSKEQGKIEEAIAAYTEAVKTLQSLRSDLVAINQDVQFTFRDSVEPVYRELVGLLLESTPNSESSSQERIKQARDVLESLQLAELDNFFQESCLDAKPVQIDAVDTTAAVIYPIILPDRLEVILSIPKQPLRHYATAIASNQVQTNLDKLRQSISPLASKAERLRLSKQFYDALITPAIPDLTKNGIKTLVFVPDGLMRNLPMAILNDGNQYLIEQYRVAVTPGLQLLESKSLTGKSLKVLTGGLTEARQSFAALPAVGKELKEISSEVPSTLLLNENFTTSTIQAEIKNAGFPVIHLATHGQFSSNAKNTFILTWDNKINVKELDELLRSRGQGQSNAIELLVLSACQTAIGDKRAALGLAGMAVRSGARSTIASLWSVNDAATSTLMSEFYRQLNQPGVSKSEALRLAQLSLLKNPTYNHPFYWAAFVLVGNWL